MELGGTSQLASSGAANEETISMGGGTVQNQFK